MNKVANIKHNDHLPFFTNDQNPTHEKSPPPIIVRYALLKSGNSLQAKILTP